MDQGGPFPQPPGQDSQQEPQQPHQTVVGPVILVPLQPVLPASMPMNWYPLKPKFSCKPGEDPEAHLLRMIDMMETNNFRAGQRQRRCPLPSAHEARLWYQSTHPFQDKSEGLQVRFFYDKEHMGTLFHAWRSFHFDENADN